MLRCHPALLLHLCENVFRSLARFAGIDGGNDLVYGVEVITLLLPLFNEPVEFLLVGRLPDSDTRRCIVDEHGAAVAHGDVLRPHAEHGGDGSGHTHDVDVDVAMILDELVDGQPLIDITARRGDSNVDLLVGVCVKKALDILGACSIGARPPVVALSYGAANHHTVFHVLVFFDAKVSTAIAKIKYVNY